MSSTPKKTCNPASSSTQTMTLARYRRESRSTRKSFTKSDTAQELFAQNGFRPVNPAILKKYASKYPTRPGIFTIDDKTIGGWRAADKRWFDPNQGVMAGIEKAVGG